MTVKEIGYKQYNNQCHNKNPLLPILCCIYVEFITDIYHFIMSYINEHTT